MISKKASLLYTRTKGPGLDEFSIEDHLLKIGDFKTLNPWKVLAQLELFQSPFNLNFPRE